MGVDKQTSDMASEGTDVTAPAAVVAEKEDAAVEVAEETSAAAPEVMTLATAVPAVLRQAAAHGGLACGLREVVAALDRGDAVFCVLARDCDEPAYVRLVEALCAARQITLVRVPEGRTLGQWAGLCKVDREGQPRKVRRCSACVVKGVGQDASPAVVYLNDQLQAGHTLEIDA